jgi:lysophospholipase L1-like esterase
MFMRRAFLILALAAPCALAELPWQFDQHTRYMALGDSLASGYGAIPATQGYVYQLYHSGIIGSLPNTIFCNAAVPGATSADVLKYQVPQAINVMRPGIITISVGGNDLFKIMAGAEASQVLAEFAANFDTILGSLRAGLPDAKIYVGNLYTIPEIPGADQTIPWFNAIVVQVAGKYNVPVADVYTAFLGKQGLLLVERHGASATEAHPTNAGYGVMAKAYEAVMKGK